MAIDCAEYRDLAAADVDGVLTSQEQEAVDAHVVVCPRCTLVRRQQQNARSVIRGRATRYQTPPSVRQRLLSSLDAVDRQAGTEPLGAGFWSRLGSPRRLVITGAIAALVVLVLQLLGRSPEPDLIAMIAEDVRQVNAEQVQFAMRTDDVGELQRYYRSTGHIDFEDSVDDFGQMGLHLVGGKVAEIEGVRTTFTVYQSDLGRVLCRRFRAEKIKLPEGGEHFGDVRLFTVDGVTICVMTIGDVICVLASSMPREVFLPQIVDRGLLS